MEVHFDFLSFIWCYLFIVGISLTIGIDQYHLRISFHDQFSLVLLLIG